MAKVIPESNILRASHQGKVSKILIVEDDPILRLLISEMLSCSGALVKCVATADEGLALVASELWSLIITDVQTPGDINGIDLARAIRAAHQDVPVIVTSGRTDMLVPEAVPGALFISKPWDVDCLQALVENNLILKYEVDE
ncbi:response regulator [Pseudomonas fluorescens]|uniref:response regulator n=1 Tax=Pseudomonas fluorescens TaxID=294 RepID=UPI0020C1F181|nr:response regulator [Pseudomonas fluorescens]UTL92355.1 response regulator [Pseudomonas fluorescens]